MNLDPEACTRFFRTQASDTKANKANNNVRTYDRSAGSSTWVVGAADDSTSVFVSTTFKPAALGLSQVVAAATAPKLFLGGTAE